MNCGCSVYADVLRIMKAYHDMATYNIEDGTGGLDASLQYEMGRPEVCLMLNDIDND